MDLSACAFFCLEKAPSAQVVQSSSAAVGTPSKVGEANLLCPHPSAESKTHTSLSCTPRPPLCTSPRSVFWSTASVTAKEPLCVYSRGSKDPSSSTSSSVISCGTKDLVSSGALHSSRQTSSFIFHRSSFNFCLPSASSLMPPFS